VTALDNVRDEATSVARSARWITIGMAFVGLSNYGYSLLLTHLINVGQYSVFAAGQGLILWATNIATISVPWVLAQALVRARSGEERDSAIRFAKLASGGSGLIAAVIVGAIATRLGDPTAALVAGLSTLVIFLGTTTTGWLQGRERMRSLTLLFVAENLLKNGAGVLLVVVAGLNSTGALAAFGIGGLAMLVRWPRRESAARGSWRELVNGELWRRAAATAAAQGLVSLFVSVDVVLVAILPGTRAMAASYQASATLTRIPVYLAGAIATAFFPALSRVTSGGTIAARAVGMFAAVSLPVTVILATVQEPLLTRVFPAQYGAMGAMLKYTAVTGLAAGGIALATAFFQAANDYSCLKWLTAGLAGYVVALLVGWKIDGVTGLAAGGAIGATATLLIMGYRLVRSQGRVVLAWVHLSDPLMAAAVLIALRPRLLLWMAAATLVGARAVMRFLRPEGRAKSRPDEPLSPASLLVEAIWRDSKPRPGEPELRAALALGQLNRVEGRLARAFPTQLAEVLADVQVAAYWYTRVLRDTTSRLHRAMIPAVLIEEQIRGDSVCGHINLVVPSRYWPRALGILADGDTFCLQRPDMILIQPPAGPSLRLHPDLSWLGAQFLPTDRLIAHAWRVREGILTPDPIDRLRILLASGLSQQRGLDLSQLLILWDLMHPGVVAGARAEADQEGWLREFDDMLTAAQEAISLLDRGEQVTLPVRPPELSAPIRRDVAEVEGERDRAVPQVDVMRPVEDLEVAGGRLPDGVGHHPR